MLAMMKDTKAVSRNTKRYPPTVCRKELAFFVSVRLGFGLRDGAINNDRNNTTDDRIDHEQVEEVDVCQKAANRRANDPGEVGNHTQDTEAFLSLLFRQDIRDHSFMCWLGHAGKQTY